MEELLRLLVERGGSDLHLAAGSPPRIRVHGRLKPVDMEKLDGESTRRLIYGLLTDEQAAEFERELELDLSFGVAGLGRFRANVFRQRGTVAAVFRTIPFKVRRFEELGLPTDVLERVSALAKGLVLVTGSTGSGKSTTLAAMLDHINSNRPGHVVTIEDPIEFLHRSKQCLVNQREVGADTRGFKAALRRVLRQDPDVVLIGELRDLESIEAALTIAETGHLTLATLHTGDAVGTIARVVDVFPGSQQRQVRVQLAEVLAAVLAQQLLPTADGAGRVLALEVLLPTPAVRAQIRDDKVHQVYSAIQTGGSLGMRTMNQSLADLVVSGAVDATTAAEASGDPDELRRLLAAAARA
ncbi:MAG: type IV pilus twitching motility protein PilT [Planctomycetes bacterium]|nr:type IV pilus twitching motility protein PilT [Planctomycetota bacterium]